MGEYRHHVSGFFAQREGAQNAYDEIVERGVPGEQMQLFEADSPASGGAVQADSNKVLKNMVVDGTIGTAVGTGIGALAQLALGVANVSLFVASPLIAPLAMLGWGASLGGLIGAAAGAAAGAKKKDGWFSAMVRDAISGGHVVLVVEARTEQQMVLARDVIEAAVANYEDASLV